MKVGLQLKIVRSGGKVEAVKAYVADSLSVLPIPIPNIGERIIFSVDGELYKGTVKHKDIEIIPIDAPEDGALSVTVWADQEL